MSSEKYYTLGPEGSYIYPGSSQAVDPEHFGVSAYNRNVDATNASCPIIDRPREVNESLSTDVESFASGLKLFEALDRHDAFIQMGGIEPDSDTGSLAHNLVYLSAGIQILKAVLSHQEQLEVFEDFLLNATAGMKEVFLPAVLGLKIDATLWECSKSAKSLLSNLEVTKAIGAADLHDLIMQGFSISHGQALAALSRPAVIDVLLPEQIVLLYSKGLTHSQETAESTAKLMMLNPRRIGNKIGRAAAEELFGHPSAKFSNTTLTNLLDKFGSVKESIKPQSHHLPAVLICAS